MGLILCEEGWPLLKYQESEIGLCRIRMNLISACVQMCMCLPLSHTTHSHCVPKGNLLFLLSLSCTLLLLGIHCTKNLHNIQTNSPETLLKSTHMSQPVIHVDSLMVHHLKRKI